MSCEQTREVAAELALGIADGEQRAAALRHLADCADCRRLVEELSAVGDELLLLAPEIDPPGGFESRALARIAPAPRPRRRRRAIFGAVAAAGAAAAIAVVAVLAVTSDDRRLAAQYRATLAVAHGSRFEAAPLRDPGDARAGAVYGYRGAPSWIFLAVYHPYRDRDYRVELVTTAGQRIPLRSLHVDPRTGTGGQSIAVDLDSVAKVRLVGSAHDDVLQAVLPHAR